MDLFDKMGITKKCGKLKRKKYKSRWTIRTPYTPLELEREAYTLSKFWQYSKASLEELVPLEILGKHQHGLRLYGISLVKVDLTYYTDLNWPSYIQ